MALNITLGGFVYLNDGVTLANINVKYQGYFYKANAGSSSSKWNTVRTVESTGYWNINLGDGDWLGQGGNVADGDKIIVVFWKPISDGRNDTTLTEWGAFEIVLGTGPGRISPDVYTNNVQTKYNIVPDAAWSHASQGLINTDYTFTNNSDDEHSWSFGSVTMEHIGVRYGQTIQQINVVKDTSFDWGDGNFDLDSPGVADGIHQWSTVGTKTVVMTIEDQSNSVATITGTIDIKYHPPTVDFTQVPASGVLGSPIQFDNATVDTDSAVVDYDWTWTDDGVPESVNGQSFGYSLVRTPGSYNCNVELCANWNDGFTGQQTCVDKDVVFATTITITPVECYYNLSIVGTSSDGSATGYSWEVYRSTSYGIGGPYEKVWSSPTGPGEQTKDVNFTDRNYFRVVGYVHGTGATTSDDYYLWVETVCTSGTDQTEYVAVCYPDVVSDEQGSLSVEGDDATLSPSIDADLLKPKMAATT